jgi:hypothetical protein
MTSHLLVKVMRILGAMFEIGMFDAQKNGTADTNVTSEVGCSSCRCSKLA